VLSSSCMVLFQAGVGQEDRGTGVAHLNAWIDESGQRAWTARSSDHFVMSAVVVPDDGIHVAAQLLADLRRDLGRAQGDTLHWRNIKGHSDRLHVAQQLGQASQLTLSTVVVCKRHLQGLPTEDHSYLYTLRFLLERLSWLARDAGDTLSFTLAHVVRFKLATLRGYETRLRASDTQIAWEAMDTMGGALGQPSGLEGLQLADAAASATAKAFEPDRYGNTERRYLEALAPRLYRRGAGALTSYGLKIHPWNQTTRAAYPWVAAL